MMPRQWAHSTALIVTGSCLFAFASAYRDPRHLDLKKAPSEVVFHDTGLRIYLDAGYFTNHTFASVQYTKKAHTLNWIGVLANQIPNTVKVQVIVEKKIAGGSCRKRVYDSTMIPFCHSLPKIAKSYVSFLGFQAAHPPVVDCPFEAGTYALTGYQVDPSTLDDTTERGALAIFYYFTLNETIFFSYTLDVTVT